MSTEAISRVNKACQPSAWAYTLCCFIKKEETCYQQVMVHCRVIIFSSGWVLSTPTEHTFQHFGCRECSIFVPLRKKSFTFVVRFPVYNDFLQTNQEEETYSYRLAGNLLIGQFWWSSSCIVNASSVPTWDDQTPVTDRGLRSTLPLRMYI